MDYESEKFGLRESNVSRASPLVGWITDPSKHLQHLQASVAKEAAKKAATDAVRETEKRLTDTPTKRRRRARIPRPPRSSRTKRPRARRRLQISARSSRLYVRRNRPAAQTSIPRRKAGMQNASASRRINFRSMARSQARIASRAITITALDSRVNSQKRTASTVTTSAQAQAPVTMVERRRR